MSAREDKQQEYKNRSKKYIEFQNLPAFSFEAERKKMKSVFVTGDFDLLNPGHCRFLTEAKALGDILVVGVSSDYSVKRVKGESYPLINELVRLEMLTYLRFVDNVTITDSKNPHGVLALLKPAVYYSDISEWENGYKDEQQEFLVERYGGKVIKRKTHKPYFGTTSLVDHISNIRVMQILEKYIKTKVPNFTLDPEKHLTPLDYKNQTPAYKKAFNPNDLIVNFNDLKSLKTKYLKSGQKTVFVSGSYDLLHAGHARFIQKAGLEGDILVVGIPSDRCIRASKGVGRPVISQHSRAYVLACLDMVDHVVIFDDYTIKGCLEQLQPNVFFTVDESWNDGLKQSEEYKIVTKYGGAVVLAKRQAPFLSSSGIINRVAKDKVYEIFKECMDESLYEKIIAEPSILANSKI